jgi:Flp pilus assembly protein TadG
MSTVIIFNCRNFRQLRHRISKERGITAAIAALCFAAILGMAGLAIDISHLYLAGSELQNAADAAALAAAASMDGTAGGITAAVNSAVTAMNKYEFGTTNVTVTSNAIRFAANLSDFRTTGGYDAANAKLDAHVGNMRVVKVTLQPHAVPVTFAKIALHTNTVNLSRTAVAGMSINGIGNDIGLNTICNWVPLCVVQDQNGNPLSVNSSCPDKTRFTPGCTYTIKAGSNGHGTGWVSPGNYQCLAPPGDQGGSDLRDNLALGVKSCIHPGDIIGSEPGNKTGPVRQGLNARFGDYSGNLSYLDAPADTNVKEGVTYAQYRSGLPQYTESSGYSNAVPFRRVIIIPIIEQDEFDHGRDDTIKIHDLAPFFLINKVPNGQGDIVAEYIGTGYAVGQAYYDPTVTYTGTGRIRVVGTPVLYQ